MLPKSELKKVDKQLIPVSVDTNQTNCSEALPALLL